MNIALIGYGKMGKEIELAAIQRNHKIVSIIDVDNQKDFDSKEFLSAQAAIEFTRPESALNNFEKCFQRNIPVVAGTTGWYDSIETLRSKVLNGGHSFLYASNFSVGVNILFALNRYLAQIMNRFEEYDVSMEEIHHVRKLDSPSGTAITLAQGITDNIRRKKYPSQNTTNTTENLTILSRREGETTGIHKVTYESDSDLITIRHDAKNRKGFATGAVIAAEFLQGKSGFYEMNDVLNL
ncbi:MAG: 4-hydroxy-tetrahydrodipicolinate reductase [Dysgonamonadaceae bacterium]|jgi:4-hydroxy-tetrahydrodipicolinate reductase|nr:4-hydroxy-tetrahydrodipicolinate reductase [Dysgonamonadaceae bacterium]